MAVFSFIKKLLGRLSKPSNGVHFMEDSYCQIELLPKENYGFLIEEVKAISEFSIKHSTESGFTALYERQNNPIPTTVRNIPLSEFENLLKSIHLPIPSAIYYESDKKPISKGGKTRAFGETGFIIFYDFEANTLNNIWLSLGLITSVDQFEKAENALELLGHSYDLLLVDWNSLEVIDLKNADEVNEYLMKDFK